MRKTFAALALLAALAAGSGCRLFRGDDDHPSRHYYPPATRAPTGLDR